MTRIESKPIDRIAVAPDSTIRDVLETISKAADFGAPIGIALVLADDKKLLGVVTDGDIRRAIVGNKSLDTSISEIMTANPVTVPAGMSGDEMIRRMREQVRTSGHIRDTKVEHLITVDQEGRAVEVFNSFDLLMRTDMRNWTVGVLGLGFVGLTLAVSLAEAGYAVHGIESNRRLADNLREAQPHFHEIGLAPLLKHQLAEERFTVNTEIPNGIDIYVVAVGTPVEADVPNLASVTQAARMIGKRLKRGDLVLVRSTVPVGTTRSTVGPVLEEESGLKCGDDFSLAFAPERTVEGNALKELRSLPQVVGGYDDRSLELSAQFFGRLSPNIVRLASIEAAEMVKLINNTFRDVSFAFANEFAMICDAWDLDAVKIIEAANRGYPRNEIPLPSPGVGGFCLTKDPLIYAHAGREKGYEPLMPVNGRIVNRKIVRNVTTKVLDFLVEKKGTAAGAKVFIVGFAFKGQPETSDLRHSTTLDLLPSLTREGCALCGYDPVVPAEDIEGQGVPVVALEDGFAAADCVLVMNNHRTYSSLDLFSLLPLTNKPALFFDGWHIFDRSDVEQVPGITYEGLSGAI